ncbi:hypothetical protein C8J56DRAFT_297793 [Mycena floridula]|nr:hypothetical protein C8J56DRAFT_297793 [Mycena floridula]
MPSHLCRIVFSLLFLHSFCFAKSVTNIIDDSNGSQIDYQPNLWAQGAGCQTCDAKPDPSQAIQGTWRDGSYLPGNNVVLTASTSFSGTSVSVYAILAHGNSAWLANKIIFLIDGQQAGSYSQPQSDASAASGFAYNQQIFAQSGLSSGSHNLVIQCGENNLGTSSTLLLDYVQYTFDDGTTTTTPTQAQSGAGVRGYNESSECSDFRNPR